MHSHSSPVRFSEASRSGKLLGGAAWLWKHHGWVLAGLWVAMQASLLWQHHGPRYVHDSGRYWYYATRIAEEWVFEPGHGLRYVGYPLFVSAWIKLGFGRWGVVLGQLVVAGVAVVALYDAIRRLSNGNKLPAAAAAAALILWRDSQQFNIYVLTESLFTSFTTLAFWALVQAYRGSWPRWVLFVVVLLLAGIVRPNGFVVAAAGLVAGVVALRLQANQRPYYFALGLLLLSLPVAWVVLNKLLYTFTLIETYLRGEVIYGYSAWVVEFTEPPILPAPQWTPVVRLAYFAFHNPVYFAKLALLKVGLLYSQIKSYYSVLHVVAMLLFIYPCYWLAWRGLRTPSIWLPARVFPAAVMVLQSLVVMMTVEDWDVRFLVPVLPCVFALAALGISPLLVRLQKRWPWLAA